MAGEFFSNLLSPEGTLALGVLVGAFWAFSQAALGGSGAREYLPWHIKIFYGISFLGFCLGVGLIYAIEKQIIDSVFSPGALPQLPRQTDLVWTVPIAFVIGLLVIRIRSARRARPKEIKAGERIELRSVEWTPVLVRGISDTAYIGLRIDNESKGVSAKLLAVSFSGDKEVWTPLNMDDINPTQHNIKVSISSPKKIFQVAENIFNEAFLTFEGGRQSTDLKPGLYDLQIELFEEIDNSRRALLYIAISMEVILDKSKPWSSGFRKKVEWVLNE